MLPLTLFLKLTTFRPGGSGAIRVKKLLMLKENIVQLTQSRRIQPEPVPIGNRAKDTKVRYINLISYSVPISFQHN